jgi:hypothetical protein
LRSGKAAEAASTFFKSLQKRRRLSIQKREEP